LPLVPVQNTEIAGMFDQAAELLEIAGENQFRVRAYRRAARTIEGLPQSVKSMVAAGRDLSDLPGIGKDLAGKIADIVATGHFALLDSLKKKLPGELGEMAALPGLGPKRLKLLHDRLKINTFDDLRRVIRTGGLHNVKGFGTSIEQKLAAALEKPVAEKRFKLSVAEAEADALVSFLHDSGQITVAGSYRRRRDTVGDLDLVVTADDAAVVGDKLAGYENVAEVLAHGKTRTTVVLRSGIQVDVRAVPEQSYGAALLYFTGSKAHNIALRAIAVRRGWKLNEYGLFSGTRRIAGLAEEDIYRKLGLSYIPPEMREDRGEIALAQAGDLPALITQADIRGDLHVHSDWTDGTASIEAMAMAAQAKGYQYIALTDHSRRVAMAHGLDPARVGKQAREIDRVSGQLRSLTILKGIEVDILKDGSLDLPDSCLAKLDIVLAAVHSYFDLPRDAQTDRVIKAMGNPHVSIIAHPTGRLLGQRDPYEIDMERVIAAARATGCHLEINSQPERLDLNDLHIQAAKQAGVKLAVSTDAHSTNSFDYIRFGVDQARRGWLTVADVINTKPLADLRKMLRR
jgi:DNA polymerase (family X)